MRGTITGREPYSARIKVKASSGNMPRGYDVFNVAVGRDWRQNGCCSVKPIGSLGRKEAYQIFYFDIRKGKIVEADYPGGPKEFEPILDISEINKAPFIYVPDSIAYAAWTPVCTISENDRSKYSELIIQATLQPYQFKPLSNPDLDFIRKNCFRV